MVDPGTWLHGLGLGCYEQAFRDNDIDATLLPTLTAEDLCGLGVVSLGHRKRLLAAIAELRGTGEMRLSALAVPQAERRQLTVMFVDLVSRHSDFDRFKRLRRGRDLGRDRHAPSSCAPYPS
jgi:hypothetical protein